MRVRVGPRAVTDEDWIPPEGFVPLAVNEVSHKVLEV
jgi:hypothetical protein